MGRMVAPFIVAPPIGTFECVNEVVKTGVDKSTATAADQNMCTSQSEENGQKGLFPSSRTGTSNVMVPAKGFQDQHSISMRVQHSLRCLLLYIVCTNNTPSVLSMHPHTARRDIEAKHLAGAKTVLHPLWDGNASGLAALAHLILLVRFYSILPTNFHPGR